METLKHLFRGMQMSEPLCCTLQGVRVWSYCTIGESQSAHVSGLCITRSSCFWSRKQQCSKRGDDYCRERNVCFVNLGAACMYVCKGAFSLSCNLYHKTVFLCLCIARRQYTITLAYTYNRKKFLHVCLRQRRCFNVKIAKDFTHTCIGEGCAYIWLKGVPRHYDTGTRLDMMYYGYTCKYVSSTAAINKSKQYWDSHNYWPYRYFKLP